MIEIGNITNVAFVQHWILVVKRSYCVNSVGILCFVSHFSVGYLVHD